MQRICELAISISIKALEWQKTQLEEEVKKAQTDRSDAETEVSHATVLREKEAAAFAALKADLDANVVAIIATIAALERGMASGSGNWFSPNKAG